MAVQDFPNTYLTRCVTGVFPSLLLLGDLPTISALFKKFSLNNRHRYFGANINFSDDTLVDESSFWLISVKDTIFPLVKSLAKYRLGIRNVVLI